MIKEIITQAATGQHTVAKQFYGYGNWAQVSVRLNPNENVEEYNIFFELANDGFITNLDAESLSPFRKAVLEGVRYALSRGILSGNPVVHLDVTITKINGLPGETTPESVKYATCQAIWNALLNASPELLETTSGRKKSLFSFESVSAPKVEVYFDTGKKLWVYDYQ